ncbi:hypothetical protein HU734_010185 [Pseudomonas wayambapalatensis]|nr:hypothetical protein HU734_010185 [Pseudomonas wayambapalatensis]
MKKLEFWGGVTTLLYLTLMGWWIFENWNDFLQLKLNELGDFLAGTFGPIAFLWLVLGFLQQGRELKLSTDALQLQAEELRNSVAQQSIMAEAAVQQIDSARKAIQLQVEEAERAVSADFEVGSTLKQGAPEGVRNKFKITNNRNVAYKVVCEFSGDLPFCTKFELGTLKAGCYSEGEYAFSPDHAGTGVLSIFYEDVNGKEKLDIFSIWIDDGWIKSQKLRNKSSTVIRA